MAPIDMIGVDSYNDLIFTHSKLLSNNSIVWCGYRSNFYEVQQSWKYLPVILKTDLTGNPIWYREYNIFPLDKGDKGFSVVSFTETPDHGFFVFRSICESIWANDQWRSMAKGRFVKTR